MSEADLPSRIAAHRFRSEAEAMERRGLQEAADLLRWCADESESIARDWEMKVLTLDEAGTESELRRSTLRKKVAAGEIPNAGNDREFKVLRRDVPKRKPLARTPQEAAVDEMVDRTLTARQQAS